MKVKPKEVLVNLPVVHMFDSEEESAMMASHFNTFLHGKVRLKYDILGQLSNQYVSIFYLQRNNEFQQLRNEFMALINAEEVGTMDTEEIVPPILQEVHEICNNCEESIQLHYKGLVHCICGEEWDMKHNKCESVK